MFSEKTIHPHIYYIHQSRSIGGAETFLGDLLHEFQKKQLRVHIFSNNHKFLEKLRSKKIHSTTTSFTTDFIGDWKGLLKAGLFLLPTFIEYVRIIRSMKQNSILLVSGFPEKILCTPIAKFFQIPIIWIEFGPLDIVFKKFFGLPKILYQFVCNIPEKVIVSSRHTYGRLKAVSGIHFRSMEVIVCGSSLLLPHTKPLQKNTQSPIILCISRLEKGKGQDLLIRAFKHVQRQFPESKLRIVGSGDFLAELQELVATLHLDSAVQFLGSVKDISNEFRHATLCVFPSTWELEGFGLVVIEAMASGTPIIAFDHAPGNEIIQHHYTGLLAKSKSIQSLATQIKKLLKNEKLRQILIRNAKKRYRSFYTIDQTAKQYIQVFNSVLY